MGIPLSLVLREKSFFAEHDIYGFLQESGVLNLLLVLLTFIDIFLFLIYSSSFLLFNIVLKYSIFNVIFSTARCGAKTKCTNNNHHLDWLSLYLYLSKRD